MADNQKINSYTRVYGIFKTTHRCNFRKMAMSCFFLNELDAGEVAEDLQDKDNNAFYHILRSTYGQIFEGGISHDGANPRLFKSLEEYYAYISRDSEKQL